MESTIAGDGGIVDVGGSGALPPEHSFSSFSSLTNVLGDEFGGLSVLEVFLYLTWATLIMVMLSWTVNPSSVVSPPISGGRRNQKKRGNNNKSSPRGGGKVILGEGSSHHGGSNNNKKMATADDESHSSSDNDNDDDEEEEDDADDVFGNFVLGGSKSSSDNLTHSHDTHDLARGIGTLTAGESAAAAGAAAASFAAEAAAASGGGGGKEPRRNMFDWGKKNKVPAGAGGVGVGGGGGGVGGGGHDSPSTTELIIASENGNPTVVKKGQLFKLSCKKKKNDKDASWKRREFTLAGYYISYNDAMLRRLDFDLRDADIIAIKVKGLGLLELFSISLHNRIQNKRLILGGSSEEHRDEWLSAILSHCEDIKRVCLEYDGEEEENNNKGLPTPLEQLLMNPPGPLQRSRLRSLSHSIMSSNSNPNLQALCVDTTANKSVSVAAGTAGGTGTQHPSGTMVLPTAKPLVLGTNKTMTNSNPKSPSEIVSPLHKLQLEAAAAAAASAAAATSAESMTAAWDSNNGDNNNNNNNKSTYDWTEFNKK